MKLVIDITLISTLGLHVAILLLAIGIQFAEFFIK